MNKMISFLILLALTFSLAACGKKSTNSENKKSTPVNSFAETKSVKQDPDTNETERIETFDIDFAGLVLKYPERWRDVVTITDNGDSLVFSNGSTVLFTLYANADHTLLGTVPSGNGNTVLSVDFGEDINFKSDDISVVMQEDLNTIIARLIADYDFRPGVVIPDD